MCTKGLNFVILLISSTEIDLDQVASAGSIDSVSLLLLCNESLCVSLPEFIF